MKCCSKCKIVKDLSCFDIDKSRKDGFAYRCKDCKKKDVYNWIERNKSKQIENYKNYYLNNKEIILEKNRKYELNNKEKSQKYRKIYNRYSYEKYGKNYYLTNQEKIKSYGNRYYQNNKLKCNVRNSNWVIKNKERFRKINNIRNKIRRNIDPQFRLKHNLRSYLYYLLKKYNINKKQSVLDLIGCTVEFLKQYIESFWKVEMTWANYGTVWEIDHIKPCSSFNLSDLNQQKQCFHYSNLQPLWITTKIAQSNGYLSDIGNRNKSAKIL